MYLGPGERAPPVCLEVIFFWGVSLLNVRDAVVYFFSGVMCIQVYLTAMLQRRNARVMVFCRRRQKDWAGNCWIGGKGRLAIGCLDIFITHHQHRACFGAHEIRWFEFDKNKAEGKG